MEKIKLQVSGSQIQVVQRPAAITAGTVGLEAEFAFDSHWDNLGKTVIFRAGDKVITAALEGDTYIVPWEVLEKPDLWLTVGVYGANPEGTVVIPTLWTKVAAVYTGVAPEGDPGLEPANPVWQQTLARVANMEPQLSEHIGNTENPHGVTCGQIGAVTQKEFYDVVSNLEGGDSGELIPHLLDKENPHGVTAAQAGAAPAGYGLGENSALAQNWNTQARNGFYKEKRNGPDGENLWYGITCSGYSGETTQLAFNPNSVGVTMALRHKNNNNPDEWEYVNPPMLEGVEHRTTERFNDKPVYTKLINAGTLPAGNLTKFVTIAQERVDVMELKGFMTRDDNGGYFPLPHFDGVSGNLDAYIPYVAYIVDSGSTLVNIRALTDMSNYTAYITVKYTKN